MLLLWDILRLNTLRCTKPAFLNSERYDKRPFLIGVLPWLFDFVEGNFARYYSLSQRTALQVDWNTSQSPRVEMSMSPSENVNPVSSDNSLRNAWLSWNVWMNIINIIYLLHVLQSYSITNNYMNMHYIVNSAEQKQSIEHARTRCISWVGWVESHG